MNLDDPKLTAFALGELDEPKRSTIARAVADSSEAQRYVDEIREFAGALKKDFAAELTRKDAFPIAHEIGRTRDRRSLIDIRDEPWFWSRARPLAIAASFAILAVIGAITFGKYHKSIPEQFTEIEAVPPEHASSDTALDSRYAGEQPFVNATRDTSSQVPLRVGTSSYPNVKWWINKGFLPPVEAVRIEELVNYFSYDYPQPDQIRAFAIHVDMAGCPWQKSHQLVRIWLKRDTKAASADSIVEVMFEPARVTSYRLIGYERAGEREQNLNPNSESNLGRGLTVLYEIIPAENTSVTWAMPLLGVRLRHRALDTQQLEIITPAVEETEFASASADFKFAAAVAQFGMILSNSKYKGDGSLAAVLEWAQQGKGSDLHDQRAEFIELVRKAQALTKG